MNPKPTSNRVSSELSASPPAPLWLPALTIGFGTAVAMWLVGFVTHLPGISVPPAVVGAGMLAVWLLGSFLGGGLTGDSSVRVGIAAGLVTATVNLLILGSLLSSGTGPNELRPNWGVLLAGYFAFAAIVGAAGGWAAGASAGHGMKDHTHPEWWLSRFAWVAVFAVVPVIFSGGLVTSAKAGLAVPDWPNSFSSNMFLYPLSRMTGGIYYEHAHRLFGSLVGMTTLTMLVVTLIIERRAWAKRLVGGAFALVCMQGALGGLRVVAATPTSDKVHAPTADNALSLPLAMVHGISGQLTFALLCVIAAVMSVSWRRADAERAANPSAAPALTDNALRLFTSALVVTVVVQLSLGAASRHFQQLHALYSHAGFAVFVIVAAAFAAFRAMKWSEHRPLKTLGREVLHAVVAQAGLGLAALFLVLPYDGRGKEGAAFVLATIHQVNGAVILGLSAALWAWTRRLTTV
jgi:cytochrome c oxidase assembly protein subunit 15